MTSSSNVVPCGSLQFENGFQETGNGGQRTFDLPETSVRFGIPHKAELRLTVPNYFQNDDTASGFTSGFGDLSVGFKQQLGPTRGGFNTLIIPFVSLPTGASAISSHGYDPTIQLPWSYSLSKSWTVAGMFSLMWPTEGPRRNLTGQSSMYFDRQLTPAWDAYVEYSGAFPQRGGPQQLIDFGSSYKPTPISNSTSLRLRSFRRNARSVDRLWLRSGSRHFDRDDVFPSCDGESCGATSTTEYRSP